MNGQPPCKRYLGRGPCCIYMIEEVFSLLVFMIENATDLMVHLREIHSVVIRYNYI